MISLSKVVILALSVNEKTLREKLLQSSRYLYKYQIVIITQGFEITDINGPNLHFIRDDHFVINKERESISVIREYFTDKIINRHCPEYILFIDDDFKFRELSESHLDDAIYFMDKHPEVGLINFKMNHPDKLPYEYNFEYINPSFVYMRGGILIRTKAYQGWGGEDSVVYYEEAYLATLIYKAGYNVMSGYTDVVHRTVKSGLGRTMEEKYKDNFNEMRGGRQCLHRKGLVVPSINSEGVPNYKVPCKMSEFTESCHQNLQLKFKKEEVV